MRPDGRPGNPSADRFPAPRPPPAGRSGGGPEAGIVVALLARARRGSGAREPAHDTRRVSRRDARTGRERSALSRVAREPLLLKEKPMTIDDKSESVRTQVRE